MSVSPKNLISRFHDLKIWQKHHDGIFKRPRRSPRDSELPHLEVMEGVSVLARSAESTPERSPPQNNEEIVLRSPPKTFEEILQEKLRQEDPHSEGPPKPKRPYLKKGSGLKRYGLEPGMGVRFLNKNSNVRKKCETRKTLGRPRSDVAPASSSLTDCKLKQNVRKQRPQSLASRTADSKSSQLTKTAKDYFPKSASATSSVQCKSKATSQKEHVSPPPLIPSILRGGKINTKRNLTELKKSLDLTPLKMPSLNVQVNARWCKAADEADAKKNVHFADAGDFYFNTSSDNNKTPSVQETVNNKDKSDEGVLTPISEGQETPRGFRETVKSMPVNTFNPELNFRRDSHVQPSEQSLYEKQLEKELLIFEMLEQKAENSSFCSTSSSIMQLLTNSPTKFRVGCSPGRLTIDSTPLKSIAESVPNEHKPRIPDDATLSTDSLLMQIKVLLDKKISKEILNGLESDSYRRRPGVTIQAVDSDQQETAGQHLPRMLNMSSEPSTERSPKAVSQHLTRMLNMSSEPRTERTPKAVSQHLARMLNMSSEPQNTERSPKAFPIDVKTNYCVQRDVDKFSDEEEWSTNTEISDTSLNTSSEIETTSQSEAEPREVRDAATNTAVLAQEQAKPVVEHKAVSCSCSEDINNKLSELNREIAAFRADNSQLQVERRQLKEEKMSFEQEMKKLRKEFEDEKIEVLYELEENKKKLAKEKLVFEKYSKEARSQPNRKEREEIANLKTELASLRETVKLKDTKNGTTQARLRTQLKQLERENGNLKDEVEKLTRENARLVAQQKVNLRPSDTKIIHEINKNLSKIAKEAFRTRAVCNTPPADDSDDGEGGEEDEGKEKSRISWQAKGRREQKSEKEKKADGPQRLSKERKTHVEMSIGKRRSNGADDTVKDDSANLEDTGFKSLTHIDVERSYDRVFGQAALAAQERNDSGLGDVKKFDCMETVLEDGSKEFKYENGDFKTISSDGNYITKKYFNGDVREMILSEGVTKYTFCHDGSCHTTYADGTELFEFPSGQIEKKHRDGKYEIQFPNGVVRAVQTDGSEEITYPDGTFVQVNQDGTKNLYLPNGQREFHNEHFKRREYPNGTVKIVYNDGRQETQYCDGRVRIKDKDGNLVLDSHAIQNTKMQ